jgi:hypothetical protein
VPDAKRRSTEQMRRALGRDGVRETALATIAGAASSSCSYASAAISRTLFKKGAALIPSLAFLFASTNLVIELGIILYLLMGWQFTAAEWDHHKAAEQREKTGDEDGSDDRAHARLPQNQRRSPKAKRKSPVLSPDRRA